ncbi:MAG: MobF family relaxase [Chthoniobacteraceae bacterium]
MFTRAKIYGGASYLKNHLSANDYYAEGERIAGRWVGQGAGALGLDGEVAAREFEAVRENLHPGTSKRLTPRTKDTREPTMREAGEAFRARHGRNGTASEVANFRLTMKPVPNRVAFYDFQCSAQKSVSIMAVLAGDARLREAHSRAAMFAFVELERFAGCQKNKPKTRGRELTGNLCAAAFTHDASRALDPQLHTHFVVANATRDGKGRWLALDEYHMLKAIRYAGKVYQNELARAVKSLGYRIREARDEKGRVTGFEIEGVSDKLCKRFAKRRAEIEREIKKFEKKHGREPDSAEIARITRETRNAKLAEITTPEVHARQRTQLLPGEWEQLQAVRGQAVERADGGLNVDVVGREKEVMQMAIAHLYERRSVAQEHEVLAEALNQGLGSVELGTLRETIEREENQLVNVARHESNPLLSEYCTRGGLELEWWSIAFVNDNRSCCSPLNWGFEPGSHLSGEQRAAVKAIVSTPDRVFGFRGVAGAGKTRTLKEVHRGLMEAGHRSFYIAPTAEAAKVLRSEGFANATTVEDFLQNVSRSENLKGAVVICDEAGLQSNRQGAELLRIAQKHDCRVLLVGDVRQHVSVEAGDFLRILEKYSHLGRCEVAEIRRQEAMPAYKEAVGLLAAGQARGGLEAFDALGWLHESGADYIERAADDYLRLTKAGDDLDSVLVISPTWAENHRLTDAIRSRLKAQNRLAANGVEFSVHDSLQWTAQQKRKAANYQPGQSIVFTRPFGDWKAGESAEVRRVTAQGGVMIGKQEVEAPLTIKSADCFDVGRTRSVEVSTGDKLLVRGNAKRSGLINGQVLTVDKIEADGSIATREGVRIPSGFRQWSHGYAVTSHKSQGRTHKHVIVAAERLDAKSAYVACSRGELSCTVHTPDKARLLEHLPEGTRRAALDALSESIKQAADLGTAAQQIAEQPKRRWSERIRGRIMKTIQLVQRHRFIAERRRLALEIAANQTQTQHQNQQAPKQRPSVRIHI